MSNQTPKNVCKVDLKKGISKKDPSKWFYIFDIQVWDSIDQQFVPFKVQFLSAFEGTALKHMGYDLTILETKVVDNVPNGD